jgi:hypothetical protein
MLVPAQEERAGVISPVVGDVGIGFGRFTRQPELGLFAVKLAYNA